MIENDVEKKVNKWFNVLKSNKGKEDFRIEKTIVLGSDFNFNFNFTDRLIKKYIRVFDNCIRRARNDMNYFDNFIFIPLVKFEALTNCLLIENSENANKYDIDSYRIFYKNWDKITFLKQMYFDCKMKELAEIIVNNNPKEVYEEIFDKVGDFFVNFMSRMFKFNNTEVTLRELIDTYKEYSDSVDIFYNLALENNIYTHDEIKKVFNGYELYPLDSVKKELNFL